MSAVASFLNGLHPTLAAAVVSAVISGSVLGLTGLGKFLYDRYAVGYRLRKEFEFEQKRKLKGEISSRKMQLLNAAEDLNFRLWNLSNNISQGWHNVPSAGWSDPDNYYFHSFVYRFLSVVNLLFETDRSVLSYDSNLFPRHVEDVQYLKHVKSMKNYFCDLLMLKSFNYIGEPATNHFFRDYLSVYARFVSDDIGRIITYSEYLLKVANGRDVPDEVMQYISNIEDEIGNINHSVITGFHLMLMVFLNKYGHDYQRTDLSKIDALIKSKYFRMEHWTGFLEYLVRCRVRNDFKPVIRMMEKHRRRMLVSTTRAT